MLELDEGVLSDTFSEAGFNDVEYRDGPDGDLNEMLARACITGKPRHTYFLQKAILAAAYYTKSSEWSYERERRMIAGIASVRAEGDIMLLDVPRGAITAVVCGQRASEETRGYIAQRCASIGAQFLSLQIGKTSMQPYYVDASRRVWRFSGAGFELAVAVCSSCREPVSQGTSLCSFCSIDVAQRREAASRNPFRTLARLGLLPDYVRDMDAIGSRRAKSLLPDAEPSNGAPAT